MSVENQHPLYIENSPLWQKVQDCIDGQVAIKKAREAYLPKPLGSDDSEYKNYIERAQFAGFTTRTAEGLYGQIFSKPPTKEGDIPPLFEQFLDNVDNAGTSIDQFASDLIWSCLAKPWIGILVDHAPVPENMNVADKEKAGLTSFLRWYAAESIINWRYDVINNKETLALVVLQENYNVITDDKFTPVQKTRYRVLELVDGIYNQEVWEQVKNGEKAEWQVTETYTPMLDGKYLDFIPFYTLPAKEPEKSMLLPIAYLNIGHYQLTADYINLLHLTGTPTAYAAGIKPPMREVRKETIKVIEKETIVDGVTTVTREKIPEYHIEQVPDPVKLGGSTILFLESNEGKDPRVDYLEPSGSGAGAFAKSLENIKVDIEKMGGALIAPNKKGVETAEAARLHKSGENAVLGSFTLNSSEQITKAIRLGARWYGVPKDITDKFNYKLNQDYDGEISDSEKVNQGMRLFDSDLISRRTFWTDFLDWTEEEADEEETLMGEKEKVFEPVEKEEELEVENV